MVLLRRPLIDVSLSNRSRCFCAFATLICLACGCSQRGEATSVKPETSHRADTSSNAWVAEMDDGRSVEVKPLEPLRMEPAGEHEYFLDEDPGASFCVDPRTGNVAWRAMVCDNPNCSGRLDGKPHVFTHPVDDPPLTADGRINHGAWDRMSIAHFYSLKCPACGDNKQLHEYDPPQVAERRQLLLDQLAAARAARRKIRHSGQPLPTGIRSPSDIMRDLSSLPKLFIAAP